MIGIQGAVLLHAARRFCSQGVVGFLGLLQSSGRLVLAVCAKTSVKRGAVMYWNSALLRIAAHLAAVLIYVSPAFAACVDLRDGNSFSMVRKAPFFAVTNTILSDGTVREEREVRREGAVQRVTTTYWSGLFAVDRRSASSHIQMKLSNSAKTADLTTVGRHYLYPYSILVNGKTVEQGTYSVRTVKRIELALGGCRYPVMVVRISVQRSNGAPANHEALLSLDAGMMLGSVAMTPDWEPRSTVFFDSIKAN